MKPARGHRPSWRACAVAAAVAVLGPAAAAAPAGAGHAPPPRAAPRAAAAPADLERLRADLEAATRLVESHGDDVVRAAARTAVLRHAMDDVVGRREEAQQEVHEHVRAAYMQTTPDQMALLLAGLAEPDLLVAIHGPDAGLSDAKELVAALDAESRAVARLQRQADQVRASLLVQARPLLAAQDRARSLLARAEAAYAADQAELARLRATRERLDAVSAQLTLAVAPAVTARGARAAAAEAPVISELERTCCGLPPGFRRTGRTISGIASWYGPGFVGNPTASGSPYDPERLTAAMLAPVPLGTVVRVSTRDGRAVNVLVNDRGPFGKGRVIDLSRAASRILGFDGLKAVTVEILERG